MLSDLNIFGRQHLGEILL